MNYFLKILNNNILQTAVISWFMAQGLKVVYVFITEHKLEPKKFFSSGGMPSSHSAFTVSLAVEIGFATSFEGAQFALAAAFAIIVMYDSAGIRRSAGEHARTLNTILLKTKISESNNHLKESLGHTPMQVFAGAVLGVFVAILRYI